MVGLRNVDTNVEQIELACFVFLPKFHRQQVEYPSNDKRLYKEVREREESCLQKSAHLHFLSEWPTCLTDGGGEALSRAAKHNHFQDSRDHRGIMFPMRHQDSWPSSNRKISLASVLTDQFQTRHQHVSNQDERSSQMSLREAQLAQPTRTIPASSTSHLLSRSNIVTIDNDE